jgi:hypothetical protein
VLPTFSSSNSHPSCLTQHLLTQIFSLISSRNSSFSPSWFASLRSSRN